MKRFLCVTALMAVLMIPDWASACWRRGGPVFERAYYARTCYRGPMYYAAQPMYCQPAYGQPIYVHPGAAPAPMHPPRVVPGAGRSDGPIIDPARPIAKPIPAPADIDPVRPAAGTDTPKPQPMKPDVAKPEPAPAPAPNEPKRGGSDDPKIPIPDPKIPPLELPKLGGDAKVPPLELPKNNPPKNEPPKAEIPKPMIELPTRPDDEPKIPALDPKPGNTKMPPLVLPGGTAVPAPAPAPDALIPPPGIPTPKNPDALPPLVLPPDSPVMPEKESKPVEVKSSPLTTAARELKVSVFPAAGNSAATAGGLRKVGFYNHTKRDLVLTIEGKSVTLPAMSYVHAQLPPTFTWKCADQPAAKETVPADATGVDVLIRE